MLRIDDIKPGGYKVFDVSWIPTTWMQEVEQCRSNCRAIGNPIGINLKHKDAKKLVGSSDLGFTCRVIPVADGVAGNIVLPYLL